MRWVNKKRTCSIEGCERPVGARGWCPTHYERWRAHGSPFAFGKGAMERFVASIEIDADGHWLWQGSLTDGYGSLVWDGQERRVHRFAYEQYVGPIPLGLVIDHLCRIRRCVNPEHLEAVTNTENIRRGVGASALNAAKTHCKWGHEFTPKNTIERPDGRECRACRKTPERLAANAARQRERRAAQRVGEALGEGR